MDTSEVLRKGWDKVSFIIRCLLVLCLALFVFYRDSIVNACEAHVERQTVIIGIPCVFLLLYFPLLLGQTFRGRDYMALIFALVCILLELSFPIYVYLAVILFAVISIIVAYYTKFRNVMQKPQKEVVGGLLLATMLAPASVVAQPTAKEWNKDVVGWNLGNQLECSVKGFDGEATFIGLPEGSINAETAWGNPVITKEVIKAVKDAGFNAIRIPVRWQYHIADVKTMTVDKAWMARVKQVVDWCLQCDMKVMINTHHDKWLEGRPTYQYKEENNRMLALLWKNIANEFAKYDYRLAFAGTNEVHIKDNWGKPEPENLAVQNSYNQTFIDAVRATGGNNAKRNLIVQTYVCNAEFGVDNGLIIPIDKKGNGNDYMTVEFHYYQPWDYAGECKYNFWGEKFKQYGKIMDSSKEEEMIKFFERAARAWSDKGLGVTIGEWGVTDRKGEQIDKMHENMTYYCQLLVSEASRHGFSTFVWDNNAFGGGPEFFGIFDRWDGMKVRAPWILQGIMGCKRQ